MKKLGLTLLGFAFLVGCASTRQSPGPSPKVGENAPNFSLTDISGNEVRLSDFKEKQNVVLIFYTSYSYSNYN